MAYIRLFNRHTSRSPQPYCVFYREGRRGRCKPIGSCLPALAMIIESHHRLRPRPRPSATPSHHPITTYRPACPLHHLLSICIPVVSSSPSWLRRLGKCGGSESEPSTYTTCRAKDEHFIKQRQRHLMLRVLKHGTLARRYILIIYPAPRGKPALVVTPATTPSPDHADGLF